MAVKDRKRELVVLVGYVTKSGLKVAEFRNDHGSLYTTRVNVLTDEGDCSCESNSTWGMVCYHMIDLAAMPVQELIARKVVKPVVSTIGDIGERGSLTHTAEETASALAFINAYRNKSA